MLLTSPKCVNPVTGWFFVKTMEDKLEEEEGEVASKYTHPGVQHEKMEVYNGGSVILVSN